MAATGYIETLLGGLRAEEQRTFKTIFSYLLNTLSIGPLDHGDRAENFQLYAFSSTTPATARQEFSVAHGLGTPPHLLLPVLPLDSSGASLVPVTATRPADAERVYLSSPTTNAVVWFLLEV